MTRDVKLNELDELLGTATYPLSAGTAKTEFDDVAIQYADGTERLTDLLERVPDEQFDSVGDLRTSILNVVPVEGVGEPGQSEGEG